MWDEGPNLPPSNETGAQMGVGGLVDFHNPLQVPPFTVSSRLLPAQQSCSVQNWPHPWLSATGSPAPRSHMEARPGAEAGSGPWSQAAMALGPLRPQLESRHCQFFSGLSVQVWYLSGGLGFLICKVGIMSPASVGSWKDLQSSYYGAQKRLFALYNQGKTGHDMNQTMTLLCSKGLPMASNCPATSLPSSPPSLTPSPTRLVKVQQTGQTYFCCRAFAPADRLPGPLSLSTILASSGHSGLNSDVNSFERLNCPLLTTPPHVTLFSLSSVGLQGWPLPAAVLSRMQSLTTWMSISMKLAKSILELAQEAIQATVLKAKCDS